MDDLTRQVALSGLTRRIILHTTAASAAVAAPAILPASLNDPLINLAEAEAATLKALDAIYPIPHTDAEIEPYYRRRDAIEADIITTSATTFPGLLVKLRTLGRMTRQSHTDHKGAVDYEAMEWEEHLALSIAAAAERLAGHNLTDPVLDLARRWHAAEQQQRTIQDDEDAFDEAVGRTDAIAKELASTPATTPAGVAAKAKIGAHYLHMPGEKPLEELHEIVAHAACKDAARLAATSTLPILPAPIDDSAILALAEDWKRINVPVDTDEEVARNAERETEITEALPDMPAATPAGIRLKVVVLHYLVQSYHEPALNQRFVASILADLDRMAGGA